MSITDSRMEKALVYLAETDPLEAELKTDMLRQEQKWKSVKDATFLLYSEGSIPEKQARANNDPITQDALERYLNAVNAHRAMDNKRRTESMVIEVWRSVNATRRAINIT